MDLLLLRVMQQVWLWEQLYVSGHVCNQSACGDSGSVINIVSVSAETPSGEDINADNTNTIGCGKHTRFTITNVSKSVSAGRQWRRGNGIGDVATYTIAVENTGNVTLENITVVDILTDLNGNNKLRQWSIISGSDQGSALGTLQPRDFQLHSLLYNRSDGNG